MRLGAALDPDKGQPSPDADAVRSKLGEYYKSHRTELNHNTRSYLCMILYPEIKRALNETVVANYPVDNVEVTDLLKGVTAAAKRSGGPSFDFTSIRIDTSHIDPAKLTIRGPDSFYNATGLQVLRFIATSLGGRYDIDDSGVFIYAEPRPSATDPH